MKLTSFQKTLINKENRALESIGGEAFDGLCKVALVAGKNGAETTFSDSSAKEIVCVLAVTTATGAVATKFLLAATTDYTFADGVLSCVGDKSAVTLIVVYK
ncbi:MAG TPA: hypothetical protein VEF53_18985 [Patescibacteria group bacterium]|nr:hypothetical protein [Patescibacteria group bacterium]